MPANVYECMMILNANKYSGDSSGVLAQIQTTLDKHHVEVLVSRPWDERRLAYPIEKQKKGMYHLFYFRTDGKNLTPLEEDFRLNDTILRWLLLRIDPKLVDTMLALAREEPAQPPSSEAETASAAEGKAAEPVETA